MGMSKEYAILFNGITNAINDLEELEQQLKELQQQAEAIFMDEDNEPESILFPAGNQ